MALVNCESSNGYLEATANGGYGISEVESANGKTIVNVRNILTTWEATTSINQSTENGVLDPIIPLQKGDSVAIVNDAGEIVKCQLSKGVKMKALRGIQEGDPSVISSGSASGWHTDTVYLFDDDLNSRWYGDSLNGVWYAGYNFQNPKKIVGYIVGASSYSCCYPTKWEFQGSNDGGSWVTVDTQENAISDDGKEYFFEATANYSQYRIYITAVDGDGDRVVLASFNLITESDSIFDVSDVQSGTVTTYSLSDRVYFRGENTDDTFYTSSSVSIDENSLNYDNTVPKLQYQSLQKRVAVPECTEIASKYELSVTGQKMIDSSFDIYVDEE